MIPGGFSREHKKLRSFSASSKFCIQTENDSMMSLCAKNILLCTERVNCLVDFMAAASLSFVENCQSAKLEQQNYYFTPRPKTD
jgi:hypothetical protein